MIINKKKLFAFSAACFDCYKHLPYRTIRFESFYLCPQRALGNDQNFELPHKRSFSIRVEKGNSYPIAGYLTIGFSYNY
jgi:hypothetical protein